MVERGSYFLVFCDPFTRICLKRLTEEDYLSGRAFVFRSSSLFLLAGRLACW